MMPFADRPPDEADLARAVRLASRYDRSGPRYTSYPPAPHFTPEVDAEVAFETYASRGSDAVPLSLYVHLPFCEEMCTYCACNVIVNRNPAMAARYLETLFPEIDRAAAALAGGNRRVAQFHLGGGTPTWFPPEDLARLHAKVAEHFSFEDDAELAVEVDPGVTTRAHVDVLAGLGWNRISMGVQDFDPVVQAAVNREQSLAETERLVADARNAGFESVNVDLMYGLPHQRPEGFARTLDLVCERLDPDRVSLFGYAHVPWLKSHQKRIDEAALPGPEARLALFHVGVQAFVSRGYEFIGMDHFARPGDELARARQEGTLHRNFMGFHTRAGTDMVAFGVTGIGQVQGVYLQNEHKLGRWEAAVREGRLPVHRGYRLTEDDRLRAAIIQDLMCNGRAGRAVLAGGADATGDWRTRFPEEVRDLEPMVEDGVVLVDETGVRLTPLGRLFVRNACMVFDGHLRAGRAVESARGPRYSRTV